jgi:4-azaleucine resistance transporter AzlC
MNNMHANQDIFQGIKDSIAVSIAGGIFGIVFGALAHTKGINLGEASFMSAFVFAGAAQMVSLTIWNHQHQHILALVGTTMIICLRFLLMATTLRPHFEGVSRWKAYLAIFFLIDENWALTIVKHKDNKLSNRFIFIYFVTTGVLFYLFWVLGTVLGNLFSEYIKDPRQLGLDFAFVALFLGLLFHSWRGKHDIVPWVATLIIAVICKIFIPGAWYIIIAALCGSFIGVLNERFF